MTIERSERSSDVEQMSSEKAIAMHKEYQTNNGLSQEDLDFLANFSDERKQKVIRKVIPKISNSREVFAMLTKCLLDRSTYRIFSPK